MKLTFLTAIGAVLLAAPAFGQGVPLQAHLTGPVQPVVKFEIVGKTIWIRALRAIRRGEEITYDYCIIGERTIPCRCRPGCPNKI